MTSQIVQPLRAEHGARAERERINIHSFNLRSSSRRRRRGRSPLPSQSPTRCHQVHLKVGTPLQSLYSQVPSRTVFTVVDAGQTKSLFADTFESSLEVVAVSDLKSTEIDSHRVVYAHVQTNMPRFGVTVSDELSFYLPS